MAGLDSLLEDLAEVAAHRNSSCGCCEPENRNYRQPRGTASVIEEMIRRRSMEECLSSSRSSQKKKKAKGLKKFVVK